MTSYARLDRIRVLELGEHDCQLLWGTIQHALHTTRRELEIIGRARTGPLSAAERAALVADLRDLPTKEIAAHYDAWRSLVAHYEDLLVHFS